MIKRRENHDGTFDYFWMDYRLKKDINVKEIDTIQIADIMRNLYDHLADLCGQEKVSKGLFRKEAYYNEYAKNDPGVMIRTLMVMLKEISKRDDVSSRIKRDIVHIYYNTRYIKEQVETMGLPVV